jgi:hypothetical protein
MVKHTYKTGETVVVTNKDLAAALVIINAAAVIAAVAATATYTHEQLLSITVAKISLAVSYLNNIDLSAVTDHLETIDMTGASTDEDKAALFSKELVKAVSGANEDSRLEKYLTKNYFLNAVQNGAINVYDAVQIIIEYLAYETKILNSLHKIHQNVFHGDDQEVSVSQEDKKKQVYGGPIGGRDIRQQNINIVESQYTNAMKQNQLFSKVLERYNILNSIINAEGGSGDYYDSYYDYYYEYNFSLSG